MPSNDILEQSGRSILIVIVIVVVIVIIIIVVCNCMFVVIAS